MIITEVSREIETSNFNTKKFGLSITSKTFDILSSKLYSRKAEAIIREVACNAKDSQDLINPTIPIKVKLPTLYDPIFYVEDNGLGISKEKFPMVCTYFASDKTQSNVSIGGFGLGFKSPFCIVDNFIVESRYDKILTIYSCFKNETGEPDYVELNSQPTDRENGVRIQAAIPQDNINEFHQAAFKIFKYWDLKPEFIGCNPFENYKPTDILEFDDFFVEIKNNNYNTRYEDCICLVGPVAYDVKFKDIPFINEELLSQLNKFENFKFIFKFNVGELAVSPTRESLDFDVRNITEKSTHIVLINKIKEILSEIKHRGILVADKFNNPHELITFTNDKSEETKHNRFYLNCLLFLDKHYFNSIWKNIRFSNNYTTIYFETDNLKYYKVFNNVKERYFSSSVNIQPNLPIVYFDKRVSKNTIYENLNKNFLCINLKSDIAKKIESDETLKDLVQKEFDFIKNYFQGFDFHNASDFKTISKNKNTIKEKILFRKYNGYDLVNKEIELDTNETYYVWVTKINGFKVNDKILNFSNLRSFYHAKFVTNNDLFVSETNFNRLSKKYNFVNMSEIFNDKFSKIIENIKEKQKFLENQTLFYANFRMNNSTASKFKNLMIDNKNWNELLNLIDFNVNLTNEEQFITTCLNVLQINTVSDEDNHVSKLIKELNNKFPLMHYLLNNIYYILEYENKTKDLNRYFEG